VRDIARRSNVSLVEQDFNTGRPKANSAIVHLRRLVEQKTKLSVKSQTVTEDEAEIRLDRWFRRHFPSVTQGTIQKLCRTGQIRVDGKRADAATRLLPGQTVRIPPLPEGPPPPPDKNPLDPAITQELESMILYIDDFLIALNKPHGLPVQGGPGIVRHLDGMMENFRNSALDKPRLVHRIDMDTSGLLLLARTPGMAAKMAALFRGRDVQKTYWAVVAGRPPRDEGRIELPLIKFGGLRGGERVAVAEKGEEGAAFAITDFSVKDAAARKFSWLELSPLTGRTHQLRVHCAAINTPILGDRMYGGESAKEPGFAEKLHLHARRLILPHPQGGILTLEADLPPHIRETFKKLGFEAPRPTPPSRIP
jgi:23S rRNA pseudouridine955/2504/2580 synthase